MSKIKVTFHRTYEIDKQQVIDNLLSQIDINGKPLYSKKYKFADGEIKYQAELMAMNLMSEEMVYFEDNLNDFVSSTVEIIK
jgi:hypothetical protein